MDCYNIENRLKKTDSLSDDCPGVQVMSRKEAEGFFRSKQIKHKLRLNQGVRFCKVEEMPEFFCGTMYVPSHHMDKEHTGFYYIIEKQRITFIEDGDKVRGWLKELAETQVWNQPGVGPFFADFLEEIVKNDVMFITELEKKLEKLEDTVLETGAQGNFNHTISEYRRKIMVYSHYYLQMSDMGGVLEQNENRLFEDGDEKGFSLFVDRVNRLREESQMLRDYSIQIREVYQSRVDERQNEIMKVLTIVTTVVLPLTLIAGWYGMNFKNMPELGWEYGYAGIIVISILVVVLCIWLFKKKKFW